MGVLRSENFIATKVLRIGMKLNTICRITESIYNLTKIFKRQQMLLKERNWSEQNCYVQFSPVSAVFEDSNFLVNFKSRVNC